jgi:hypothetical protein
MFFVVKLTYKICGNLYGGSVSEYTDQGLRSFGAVRAIAALITRLHYRILAGRLGPDTNSRLGFFLATPPALIARFMAFGGKHFPWQLDPLCKGQKSPTGWVEVLPR